MKTNKRKLFLLTGIALFPFTALAQAGTLWGVLGLAEYVVWSLGRSFALLAFVVFFYGLAKFILSAGDPKKLEEGKGIMTWGVLALFVMMSIMGIIGFLERSIGTGSGPGNVQITVPTL